MKALSALGLIWQLPLSLASWAAHQAIKFLLLAEAARRWHRAPPPRAWRGLSELIDEPAALWFVMIVGPRWNCHAVLADLGPLHVRQSVEIRPAAPLRTGQHLSFVIYDTRYRNAGHRVWTAFASPPDPRIPLETGVYRVSARLYGFTGDDLYPEVRVDDAPQVEAAPIGPEACRYQKALRGLRQRRSLALAFIHYHVYYVLHWRRLLGERRAEPIFVPVGNPATAFAFGVIRRGQCLKVTRSGSYGDGQLVFVAIYDRCSLPIFWAAMTELVFCSPVMDASGYFLLRALAAGEGSTAATLQWQCNCK
jgi:hypothetical protein